MTETCRKEIIYRSEYGTYIPDKTDYKIFKNFIENIYEMCSGDELEDYVPMNKQIPNEGDCHPFMSDIISKISFFSIVYDTPYFNKMDEKISDKIFSYLSKINHFACDYKHIMKDIIYIPKQNDYIFFQKFIDHIPIIYPWRKLKNYDDIYNVYKNLINPSDYREKLIKQIIFRLEQYNLFCVADKYIDKYTQDYISSYLKIGGI
jgi:hypothetical protein